MLTLFELSVVNNWFVVADGYVAVRGKHARWFFVLYYVLGVVVALNIVVAFVLDAYSAIEAAQQQEEQQAGRGEGGAAWVGDHLILDAGRVSGTSTGLTGEIEVSLDPSLSVSLTESRRAMLAALFTPRAPDGPEAAARPAGPPGEGPPGGAPQLARGASWKQQLVKAFSRRSAARDGTQGGAQGGEGPSYTPPEPAAAPPTAPGRISRGASFGEAVLGLAQAAAGATALAAAGTTHEAAGDADK